MQLAGHSQECWNAKEVIHDAGTDVFFDLQQNVLVSWLQNKQGSKRLVLRKINERTGSHKGDSSQPGQDS